MCQQKYGYVNKNTDVSTKEDFISKLSRNVWFLMMYDEFLDGIKIYRCGLKKVSEN